MVTDHVLMIFVVGLLSLIGIPFMNTGITEVKHEKSFVDFFSDINIFSVLGLALYVSKDCLNGQSFGKRIFNLQLVNNYTNEPASPFVGIIRNIFIFIWPIELLVLSINPERRIGDYITGTKVINFDPTSEPEKLNILKAIISILIPFIFFLSILVSQTGIFQFLNPNKITHKEGSFDKELSESLSELFPLVFNEVCEDSLLKSADFLIYDKTNIDTSKYYVSAILNLTDDYLSNSEDFEAIKKTSVAIFNEILGEDTYFGKVKFIFIDPKSKNVHEKQFQLKSRKIE
jgi:hypothetical protein